MGDKKPFRWISPLGLLLLVVGCSIITGDSDDDDVPPVPQGLGLHVTAESLNIRSEPTTEAPVIGKAPQGMHVTATHQAGEWYGLAMADGGTGWAHSDYLEPNRP